MTKQIIALSLLLLVANAGCPFHSLFGGSQEQAFLQENEVLEQSFGNAEETLNHYWNEIESKKYSSLPPTAGSGLDGLIDTAKFVASDMSVPIERTEDTMPPKRVKWIHPLGSCGKVKFVANQHSKNSYSGLFKGADFGIARLSLAGDPAKLGFVPGMALKFFRDQQQVSGNIISMFALNGQQENRNFFANSFSNIVEMPNDLKLKISAFITFRRVSKCPTVIALGDFAKIDQQGNEYANEKFPKQIYFVPSSQMQNKIPSDSNTDFRINLENSINVGDAVYDVYVSDEKEGTRVLVGQIVAESKFIASDYCDNTLFFKHQKGEAIGC